MSVKFYDFDGELIDGEDFQEIIVIDVENPEDVDELFDWAQTIDYVPMADFRFVETDGIYVWNDDAEAYLSLESLRGSVRWVRNIGVAL